MTNKDRYTPCCFVVVAYRGPFWIDQHGVKSRGAEPSLPEKFFDSAQKNSYAKLQNYFARLTPPSNYIIVKIPDFGHFISLHRMNSVFLFNKYKKHLFHFWLLASARKI